MERNALSFFFCNELYSSTMTSCRSYITKKFDRNIFQIIGLLRDVMMGPSPWIKTQAAASSLGFYPTSWSADLKSSVEQHSDWKAAETDAHGYWVLKKKKVVPVCYVNGQRSIEYHSCNLTCHGNWYHLISWYSSYCIVRNVAVCIWRGFFFFFCSQGRSIELMLQVALMACFTWFDSLLLLPMHFGGPNLCRPIPPSTRWKRVRRLFTRVIPRHGQANVFCDILWSLELFFFYPHNAIFS